MKQSQSIQSYMSQYANGITTIDELVQAVYTIATTVVVPNEWYNIFSMRDKYQAECRSLVASYRTYKQVRADTMAKAYMDMEYAINELVYPNGTVFHVESTL